MKSHILLIETPNEKSLVHNISGILFMHELTITNNNEFVDSEKNIFYKRTEFFGEIDDVKLIYDLYVALSDKTKLQLIEKRKKDIVVLCTKEHHCLGDLLIKNAYNELNANVLAVISNHNNLKELVDKFNIPFIFIPDTEKTREEHEIELLDNIYNYNPEYIVLAKYMKILTPNFVSKFNNRIINIHHSFLPAFVGANPYKQAYERGVKIIGATSHFVTEKLDEGPIIIQNVIHIDHTKSPKDIAHMGKELEKILLTKSLELAFDDKIFVTENKTIIFD